MTIEEKHRITNIRYNHKKDLLLINITVRKTSINGSSTDTFNLKLDNKDIKKLKIAIISIPLEKLMRENNKK